VHVKTFFLKLANNYFVTEYFAPVAKLVHIKANTKYDRGSTTNMDYNPAIHWFNISQSQPTQTFSTQEVQRLLEQRDLQILQMFTSCAFEHIRRCLVQRSAKRLKNYKLGLIPRNLYLQWFGTTQKKVHIPDLIGNVMGGAQQIAS
jgi:hypothetical protein